MREHSQQAPTQADARADEIQQSWNEHVQRARARIDARLYGRTTLAGRGDGGFDHRQALDRRSGIGQPTSEEPNHPEPRFLGEGERSDSEAPA
jgi:hypothetical protein